MKGEGFLERVCHRGGGFCKGMGCFERRCCAGDSMKVERVLGRGSVKGGAMKGGAMKESPSFGQQAGSTQLTGMLSC